ncbi:hypothetical protein [Aestuariivirga litoralis]|uniref:hypothetical protein n=1 Tax=Aestuariivirga litoralis TaxID=2650924 RepID=UPI0018C5BAB3|nr:hypothetical protein [Aestuariivirga litoralis]MBG1233000.1 hypothetical protein [Aestuariivirga litoralis]
MMDFHFHIGLWTLPLAITLIALAVAFWKIPVRDGAGAAIIAYLNLLLALVVSLIAWLIWALLA